ncbi:MAG: GntR family transcriptional regulator [Actinomycetota bacterium]|nr:GntR family transcriptional regulator [Actinomycetota bacterium]
MTEQREQAKTAEGAEPRERDAADILRDAILRGVFQPAQRLVEAELAAQLGLPRAALREALVRLEAEHLVERQRNVGARVRVISPEEAAEAMETRGVLEGLCAESAVRNATEADRERLRALGAELQELVAAGDVLTYSARSDDLHSEIHALSGRVVAHRLIGGLRNLCVGYHLRIVLKPGYLPISLSEHLGLIEAVCDGPPERAAQLMRVHLFGVRTALDGLLEDRNQVPWMPGA